MKDEMALEANCHISQGTLWLIWQSTGEPLRIDPIEYNIGVVVGTLVALGVIGYVLYLFIRHQQQQEKPPKDE